MKRSWMGAGLLVLLLAGGLLVTFWMDRIHRPLAEELVCAGEAALAENWALADSLCLRAEEAWKQTRFLRACFADHGPMEEVEADFAQLEIFLRCREATAFAAACAETAQKVRAIGEAHSLVWENLL